MWRVLLDAKGIKLFAAKIEDKNGLPVFAKKIFKNMYFDIARVCLEVTSANKKELPADFFISDHEEQKKVIQDFFGCFDYPNVDELIAKVLLKILESDEEPSIDSSQEFFEYIGIGVDAINDPSKIMSLIKDSDSKVKEDYEVVGPESDRRAHDYISMALALLSKMQSYIKLEKQGIESGSSYEVFAESLDSSLYAVVERYCLLRSYQVMTSSWRGKSAGSSGGSKTPKGKRELFDLFIKWALSNERTFATASGGYDYFINDILPKELSVYESDTTRRTALDKLKKRCMELGVLINPLTKKKIP